MNLTSPWSVWKPSKFIKLHDILIIIFINILKMCVDPWYPIGPILSIFWGFSLLSDRASRWPLDAGHHRREIVRLLLVLGQVRLLEAKGHRRHQLDSHPSHLLQPGMDPLLRRAIPVLVCMDRDGDTSKTVYVSDIDWVSCAQLSFWEKKVLLPGLEVDNDSRCPALSEWFTAQRLYYEWSQCVQLR